jgi:hypothetical protein
LAREGGTDGEDGEDGGMTTLGTIPGDDPGTAGRRRAGRAAAHRAARTLIFAAVLATLGWLGAGLAGVGAPVPVPVALAAPAHHTAHSDNNPTLSLVQPANQSGGPQGPVGAFVAARIQGAGNKTQFQLFYSVSNGACAQATMTQINNAAFTTNDNGDLTFFIAWPTDSGMGTFYLCAALSDGSSNIVQSDQTFEVVATVAPSISVAPAPVATATTGGGGTTQVTPGTGSGYTVGEQITINGTGFVPGGTQVGVYISGVQSVGNVNDLGDLLGSPLNAGQDGSFSTTVTLPSGRIGQEYIHVATTASGSSGAKSYPPLLVATQFIEVSPATPTPTATATATNTPQPHASPTTSLSTGGDGGSARILEAGGLGALSVLLLVVGAMLLISAGRRP